MTTFRKTHRLLVKSTETDYKYNTVEIDINTGLYRRTEVDSKSTVIRVNSEIYGEQIGYSQNVPLSIEDIELLEAKFNSVREEKGWNTLEFRKSREVQDEVSSSPEVQGEKEAETV